MSWKLSCTVWSMGKGRDNLKTLPIAILLQRLQISTKDIYSSETMVKRKTKIGYK